MTAFELKPFQSKAVEQISAALTKLKNVDHERDRLVVFKSPTGSGKTLVTASAIADAYQKPGGQNFIVLWLSPSEGMLHLQSAKALSNYLAGSSMSVHLLESRADVGRYQHPTPGSVFVANWDKLRAEKDGEFTNVMVREGETGSFFGMLRSATAAGLDMIVVIDESHLNLGAEKTDNLMKVIRAVRPFIRLELSATPTSTIDLDLINEVHFRVSVKFEDVEAAGLIRKSALLNSNFAEVQTAHSDDPISIQVLWAAWEKIIALRAAYEAAGSPVKPLLLIQYPDGDKAVARAAIVEQFLSDRGLSKGSSYAVWLSGEHSDDLEGIKNYDSPYQALIFKQAIATGWDCPRAQVLVQFRDPKSPIFQIQTLGRLLRSPEWKHYENDALNVAYVYSDLEGANVKVVAPDEPGAPIQDTPLRRGDKYPPQGLSLHSVFQPRTREFDYPLIGNLQPVLESELDKNIKPLLTANPFDFTPVNITVDARVTAKEVELGIEKSFDGQSAEGNLDDLYVQSMFNILLVSSIGQYRSKSQSLDRIKRVLNLWFKKHRPSWGPDQIQHFSLRFQSEIIAAINKACELTMLIEHDDAVAAARGKRRENPQWEVPESVMVSKESFEISEAGNLCVPALSEKSRSRPEKRFERFISTQFSDGKVLWWWKNGVGDEKYLGVEYQKPIPNDAPDEGANENVTETESHITYPDYLVMTASGVLWVIEVKDVDDIDGQPGGVTNAKAKGLEAWATATNEKRSKEGSLIPRPQVRTAVAVPVELSSGVSVIKTGDAHNWQAPTQSNLITGSSWKDLDLS